jgi:DNA excision repair protein ERCC-2
VDRFVRISVRNLVEYVLRSGDIDNRFVSMSRAVEGTLAHQRVQKGYAKGDLKEVVLKHSMEYGEFTFQIEGRADGILFTDDGIVIDEIKSTTRDLKELTEDVNLRHWAQGICYGYIYAYQNGLEKIGIQLTYFHLETEDTARLRRTMSFAETEGFFLDLLDRFIRWAGLTFDWGEKRDASIGILEFPFPSYRRGQRELAVAAYKTIKEGKSLFAQAPTGIGKTMSTLYPALKAMGEGQSDKIFYLTAKTLTREVPLYSMELLSRRGLRAKSLVITAKDKICLNDEVKCNPRDCPYAKGHFDRVNDAIIDLFDKEDLLTRDIIERYSQKHRICPFEFQLDMSLWSDVVICDYNYVFDPQVYLKRFFDMEKGNYVFLIDEAHNLVDRSREMFSADLKKSQLAEIKPFVKERAPKLYKAVNGIIKILNAQRDREGITEGCYQNEELTDIYYPIKKALTIMEGYLTEQRDTEGYEIVLQLYFDLLSFIRISDLYGEDFVTTLQGNSKDVHLRLFCVDASRLLRNGIGRGRSAIFFSATLTPMDYFKEVLGGNKEDYHIRLSSPFPRENLGLAVHGDISTRYRHREETYEDIAEMIHEFVQSRQGNYLIFFPSYVYMNRVFESFSNKYPSHNAVKQEGGMDEKAKESFLADFHLEDDLIAFAVLGGTFSEGIDLAGDRLIGAVIVGVGMPQLGFERNIIKDYFDNTIGEGFNYSYVYPGMNKVLQAAGRVIRTESDRGAILLIDDRYLTARYKALMPPEWNGFKVIRGSRDLREYLDIFWEGK